MYFCTFVEYSTLSFVKVWICTLYFFCLRAPLQPLPLERLYKVHGQIVLNDLHTFTSYTLPELYYLYYYLSLRTDDRQPVMLDHHDHRVAHTATYLLSMVNEDVGLAVRDLGT